MLSEPIWLPLNEAVEINRAEVAETGESYALLRSDLLESAIARPQNHYNYTGDCDILRLAVILMVAIAKNHPFEQGNKRTGFTAGLVFMAVNGYQLTWDSEDIALEFIKLMSDEITIERFEEQIVYFIHEN